MNQCNNSDFYGTTEIQNYLLNILIDMDQYCREYKIKYSLSGGTLLGAIRHKGFIPWDDDADVMFDRDNYDMFLDNFNEALGEKYKLIGSQWVKRVTRLDNTKSSEEELCVDIFPFDIIPDNIIEKKIKVFILHTLQGMLKEKPEYSKFKIKDKVLLFITWAMGRPISTRKKQKMYDTVSRWEGHGGTKVNVFNTYYKWIGTLEFDMEDIYNYVDVSFENHTFMSIKGYEKYLVAQYGDYMTLPDEKDRIRIHIKNN